MNAPAAERPLGKYQFSLRQLFLYLHIVAVVCSAVVGIGEILTGGDGEFRVLLSSVTVALGSVCGLACGAALESKRARIVPIIGIGLTLVGTALLLLLIWTSWRSFNEMLFRCASVTSIFAVAFSHVSLLSIARLSPRYSWSFPVGMVAIFLVALLISLPILTDGAVFESLIRWIAVAAIVDAAMSILIPVFHLLSRSELRAATQPSVADLDREIAELEKRLAELRKQREATLGHDR